MGNRDAEETRETKQRDSGRIQSKANECEQLYGWAHGERKIDYNIFFSLLFSNFRRFETLLPAKGKWK